MKILLIDLETTGLPLQPSYNNYYDYKALQYYNSSRVIQIAGILYDSSTQKIEIEFSYIIKPELFEIKKSIYHKIDQKTAEKNGIPFNNVIQKITPIIRNVDLFVSHNVGFDKNVLLSELYRRGMKETIDLINKIKTFCTSNGTINILKIPLNKKQYKQPRLVELYEYLFKEKIQPVHDALEDVRILMLCFDSLIKNKMITI